MVEAEDFKPNLLFMIGKIRNVLKVNVKEKYKKDIYQIGQLLFVILVKNKKIIDHDEF